MSIPVRLRAALEEAAVSVARHPEHDLSPIVRRRVLQVLCSEQEGLTPLGHQRLVWSEVMCVDRVLIYWEQWRPLDRTPHLLLAEARKLFTVDWGASHAKSVLSQTREDSDFDTPAYFVFTAASNALECAILGSSSPQDLFKFDNVLTNDNRDLEYAFGWDSCYCASLVVANGMYCDPRSDKSKRLEFWKWWEREVIPASYRQFSSSVLQEP